MKRDVEIQLDPTLNKPMMIPKQAKENVINTKPPTIFH